MHNPNAHALQLSIPTVTTGFTVTVTATEVPPAQEDGLCEPGHTVLNDFDCRFVTFFNGGTDGSGNVIVPLCYPYANGNCVHYSVNSGTSGTEPNPTFYSGGVSWEISWNNDTFVPPANNYAGSSPQFYDDPDSPPTPGAAFGTDCTQPMLIGSTPQTYSCQFEFNITTFFDPTKQVDSGIGGHTKQFNDVVVAFPPTAEIPPTQAPAFTSAATTTFTVNTPGSFAVTATGFPTPKLTAGTLPNGVTLNTVTGILGGTPTTVGTSNVTFTATSTAGTTMQTFSLVVQDESTTFSNLTASQSIPAGTASINLAGTISAGAMFPPTSETVTITINSTPKVVTIGANGAFATSFNTSAIPASGTPYTITYNYAGDSIFANATNTSTTLTVTPLAGPVPATVTLLGNGTGNVQDGANLFCTEANGITTGNCSANYTSGVPVTFTATATGTSTFGGWSGACASFGTSPMCMVTPSTPFTVTANFVAPPTSINVTFPVGTNPTEMATFNCPSNPNPTPGNPCTDPNAHALQLSIPTVTTGFTVTVTATEVPPLQADGNCETGNTVLNDFDCRFVTFFNGGTASNGVIVPLCYPYANGNCVHYSVYSGTPGTEPNPSFYSGGVSWEISWNNDTFVPPANNYAGSSPQFYDDPDSPPTPGAAFGTDCTQPMLIGSTPQTYSCQFEFNITTFFDPTKPVDSGIGGHTKQFNDVVVAFPPTAEIPPTQAPVFTSAATTTFTANTPGSFAVTATGFPTPKLTAGTLPNGVTLNTVTGILGGTPTSSGTFNFTLTATSAAGTTIQNFSLMVSASASSFTNLTASQTIPFGTASINLAGTISAGANFPPTSETVTITIDSIPQNASIGANGSFATTFNTSTIPASVTPYIITYSYAGDSNFTNVTNTSTTLTVTKLNQTITFAAPPSPAVFNSTFTVSATSTSALPVTIAATGVCSISGSTVTMTNGTGTCTLTASQAGNTDYNAATNVVRTVTASLATQTITFAAPASPAAFNSTFAVSASSTSGLAVTIAATGVCTISGSTVTMTSGTGTCTLTASQAGNTDYSAAANVVHTVTAALAAQTITFAAPPSPAGYHTTFPVSATSTSGLPVTIAATGVCTISGTTVTITASSGTCTLTASQVGNTNYSAAANVVHTVTATLANQTITFTGAPTSAPFGSTFTVTASASSGLAVTITSSGSCTISGTTVTITAGSGTCTLTATQAGNTNYNAAPSVKQTTTATKATSSTTIVSNTPNPSTVNQAVTISFKVTGSGTPTGTVTVNASTGGSCSGTLSAGAGSCSITFTAAGSPTLTATYAGDGNFNGSTSAGASQTVNGTSGSTLKFSPATLSFGTVYVGIPSLRTTTLTNTGTSMITFTNFSVGSISGDDSSGFLGVELCPKTLNAGKSCTIIMSFTSDSNVTKTHAANLVITDNAAGSPQSIPMTATVINPVASLSANSLNFGNQKTSTTSAAKSVTLTNSGTTSLILSSLNISGNFALASGTTCTKTTTLAPGANCQIKVTFTPASKGSKSGAVTIGDNAFFSTSTINLSGTGN